MSLKHEIRFEPGYDCIRNECRHGSKRCVPGGGGSHGQHGMTIVFYVRGNKGTIQFKFNIFDMIPGRDKHGYIRASKGRYNNEIMMATDLGYHSPIPMYEDQNPMSGDCEFVEDGKCYYDGSSLNAEVPFKILIEFGHDAVFEYLEGVYESRFEDGEYPEPPETKLISRKEVPAKI